VAVTGGGSRAATTAIISPGPASPMARESGGRRQDMGNETMTVFDWNKVTLHGTGGLYALMEMALHRERR